MSRQQRIREDVAQLRGLRGVAAVEFVDDALSFEVHGQQFTACIADVYPQEATEIFGEAVEFQCAGRLVDVVAALLRQLDAKENGMEAEEEDGEEAEDAEDAEVEDAMDWIVTEAAPEAALEQDLRALAGVAGITAKLTQLGSELWRLRLLVPCEHLHQAACGAWGIRNEPLSVELILPTKGYSFETVSRSTVKRIWQENFAEFALEAQLRHILGDFCEVCSTGSWMYWTFPTGELEGAASYEAKKKWMMLNALEDRPQGFLVCLARYLQLRVPTVHEYCAICDKPFEMPPMMMRTVCPDELCTYQFSEFGSKITSAETVNHPSEILDLLVCMLAAAALSSRRTDILEPYPLVKLQSSTVLHPQNKDFIKLEGLVKELQSMRSTLGSKMGASWALCTSQMSVEAAALLKWTVSSNRSFLSPIEDQQRIAAFRTPFQYLLLSAPPEKETQFQELKKKFGTSFAFHGSSAENWHSILRNGLKNASNSKLMTSGAAHGPGIYLAKDSGTSISYCRAKALSYKEHNDPVNLKRQRTGNRFVENTQGLIMMAVCEVINDTERLKKPTRTIWVAASEELVSTRFFLVFPSGPPQESVWIDKLDSELHALAERVKIF